MTTLNRSTAPDAIVAKFKTLLGDRYSEKSPAGSFGDGHWWAVGNPEPVSFCCSGAQIYVWLSTAGVLLNRGTALDQYKAMLGGKVALSAIRPGDSLFFNGSRPPVGHTGTCVTFDPATGTGTYISAYDTAEGVTIKPFSVHVVTGSGGIVGACRPANVLPVAPVPAPAPKPAPAPVENPAAHAYAVKSGMVVIDHAEAQQANLNHPHIEWYVWKDGAMAPEPIALAKEASIIYAYRNVLDAAHIPHAGA